MDEEPEDWGYPYGIAYLKFPVYKDGYKTCGAFIYIRFGLLAPEFKVTLIDAPVWGVWILHSFIGVFCKAMEKISIHGAWLNDSDFDSKLRYFIAGSFC